MSKTYTKYTVRVRNVSSATITIGSISLNADKTADIWDTSSFTSTIVTNQNSMRDNQATVNQYIAEGKIELESNISGSYVQLTDAQAWAELQHENETMSAVELSREVYIIQAAMT